MQREKQQKKLNEQLTQSGDNTMMFAIHVQQQQQRKRIFLLFILRPNLSVNLWGRRCRLHYYERVFCDSARITSTTETMPYE